MGDGLSPFILSWFPIFTSVFYQNSKWSVDLFRLINNSENAIAFSISLRIHPRICIIIRYIFWSSPTPPPPHYPISARSNWFSRRRSLLFFKACDKLLTAKRDPRHVARFIRVFGQTKAISFNNDSLSNTTWVSKLKLRLSSQSTAQALKKLSRPLCIRLAFNLLSTVNASVIYTGNTKSDLKQLRKNQPWAPKCFN